MLTYITNTNHIIRMHTNKSFTLVVKTDSVFHNLLCYLSDQVNNDVLRIDKQILFDYFRLFKRFVR